MKRILYAFYDIARDEVRSCIYLIYGVLQGGFGSLFLATFCMVKRVDWQPDFGEAPRAVLFSALVVGV